MTKLQGIGPMMTPELPARSKTNIGVHSRKDADVHVRIQRELKEVLDAEADRLGISAPNLVCRLVAAALRVRVRPTPREKQTYLPSRAAATLSPVLFEIGCVGGQLRESVENDCLNAPFVMLDSADRLSQVSQVIQTLLGRVT